MEVQFGPNSVDEPNLLYKLQRKVKVFNASNALQNRGYNLVATSSKYGIVFIAVPDGTLTVYYLKQLIDTECAPQHFTVKLQEKPTHIAVSCDQELLAVTGGQLLCVYRVTDFQNENVSASMSLKTDASPSTFVSALQWNPCIPDSIAIAFYDGTLFACQAITGQVKKVQSKARCICWSPKGKQLVTGNNDGTLCQYKPDLTPAKMVPAPNLFEGSPVEALAVYWISTFQFAVVYKNATNNSRPAVTIVNAGKTGQPSCLNYEDVCFSMGSNRPWYYYLQGLAQWNIILPSSSNSMEIATLGSTDGANWSQWCQPDEARPELPLTDKKLENYPVGICIDTCAIHQLPWGENEVLPYMPLLHVVSQSGLLTIFNIVNLNKDAAQICFPARHLSLPTEVMTSGIFDDTPKQPAAIPTAAPVAEPKPQPIPPAQSAPPVQIQSAPPISQFGTFTNASNSQNLQQPQVNQGFAVAPANKVSEPKEIKPAVAAQPTAATVQTKPVAPAPQPQSQENAALKAEQERINKMKANQELKNMLVKEVNDFQMELYKFMVKTRETQAKLQRDIESINANFTFNSLDSEQLKKECSLEELRGAVVQLKLELVRACAVVAEARTHSEAKDLDQWTQADPLTTKRVASVKKLAYYVQSQLEQVQKALDYKWNEMVSRNPQFNKPGQRMTRPRLDDVYQPLVKQQEILSRQQAVLRTLRKTLDECGVTPMFKSTSLLRNTPFRNKDPLSKLTKNVLNMSIEPQNNKAKELLTPQKIDALRDMLSNHKTVKIKPVNVELRQHLATMRINYEKSMKEKAPAQANVPQASVKTEPKVTVKIEPEMVFAPANIVKVEPKSEPTKQMPITVPSFTPVINEKPVPGFVNVARTLFTEETKQETPKPSIQPPLHIPTPPTKPAQAFSFTPLNTATASANTRSVLKDLLQNKAQANIEAKNDANTFMGQNICSPSSFAYQSAPAGATAPSAVFTAKPISDISNMFSKFTPQAFIPESKPQTPANSNSGETGETEAAQAYKKFESKAKPDKPLTNLFGMKSAMPLAASTPNVPDVLKSVQQEPPKTDNKPVKIAEKVLEKSKENVPGKPTEAPKVVQQPAVDKKEDDAKMPLSVQITNKPSTLVPSTSQPVVTSTVQAPTISGDSQKPNVKTEIKSDTPKMQEKSNILATASASSIFAAANGTSAAASQSPPAYPVSTISQAISKPDTLVTTKAEVPAESSVTKPTVFGTTTTASASSIFGAAVASQPKTTAHTGSIFSTSPTSSPSSVFGSATQGSIFGTSTAQSSVFGTSTSPPVFGSDESKPSIFSKPTPASTSSSVFATATTQSTPVFGSTSPQTSAFGTTTTTQSVFGSSTPAFGAPASSQSSVFSTVTTKPSVFGTTTATTQASVFGSTPATTASSFSPATTQSSVFGSGTTSTQSMFDTTKATPQETVFGTPAGQTSVFSSTTSVGQTTVFGAPQSQPVFGTPTQTTQASVFGSPTQTTQASVFGSPTQTTQASVFGSPTQTTQASVFGSPTQTTQSSVFGSPTQTTQASVFGTPTQTTQASVFGTPTQATQASVFGTPPTTTAQSGSLFGGAEANLFASASISTTSAPSQTSGGSIFGGGSSGSVFGSNTANVFGGKTTFGQPNPSAAAIFGGGASFGQKPAANFWSGGGATSGGSGFGSSGFGQQATTQASSIFGGGTGGSFSAPSTGQPFGSPQQATFGGGDTKPSVFGSPQQQSAPAFGGSPVFGSKTAFGQSSSFGSPPSGSGGFGGFGGFNKSPSGGFGAPASFGAAPAFGSAAFGGTSPGKVFGGTPAPTGFGSPTQQSNATFENLATQNTLTFGNLAQQSGQQPQAAPTFNTSPSFTGWRG